MALGFIHIVLTRKGFIALSTSLFTSSMCAQVSIETNNLSTATEINDIWRFSLSNTGGLPVSLDVEVILYTADDSETKYYDGVAENVVVNPQETRPLAGYSITEKTDPTTVQSASQLLGYLHVNSNKDLKQGSYVRCILLYTHEPKAEFDRSCGNFQIVSDSSKHSKLSQKFAIESGVELFSYININQPNEGYVKPYVSGISLTPAIRLMGIPFSGTLYFDTDTGFYHSTIPRVQMNLNSSEYLATLQSRLTQATAVYNTDAFMDTYHKYEEMISLDSIVNHPLFAKTVDSLKALYSPSELLQDSANLGNCMADLNQLDAVIDSTGNSSLDSYANMTEYDSLLERRDAIMARKDSLANKYNYGLRLETQLKSYTNLQTRQDSLFAQVHKDTTMAKAVAQYQAYSANGLSADMAKDSVINRLKGMDKISGWESALSGVKQLQVGSNSPFFNELSISGVLINGANGEYDHDNTAYKLCFGKLNDQSGLFRALLPTRDSNKLIGGGISQKIKKGHTISLYGVSAKFNQVDSLSYFNFLENNKVINLQETSGLYKNRLLIDMSVGLSYSQNTDYLALGNEEDHVHSPFWLFQMFSQTDDVNNGSFTDLAMEGAITAKLTKNFNLTTTYKRIGDGYYSAGNPFLLNDVESYAGQFSLTRMFKCLDLSLGLMRSHNNLSDQLNETTAYYNLTVSAAFSLKGYPGFQVQYLPTTVISESNLIQVNTLTGSSTIAYRVIGNSMNTILSGIQMRSFLGDEGGGDFSSDYLSVNTILYQKNCNFSIGYSYGNTIDSTGTLAISTLSAGSRWQAGKYISGGLNLQASETDNGQWDPGGTGSGRI